MNIKKNVIAAIKLKNDKKLHEVIIEDNQIDYIEISLIDNYDYLVSNKIIGGGDTSNELYDFENKYFFTKKKFNISDIEKIYYAEEIVLSNLFCLEFIITTLKCMKNQIEKMIEVRENQLKNNKTGRAKRATM